MPPAGQALTGACIELLASPHAPVITAHALIDLVFIRPLHQPFVFLNYVFLLLLPLLLSTLFQLRNASINLLMHSLISLFRRLWTVMSMSEFYCIFCFSILKHCDLVTIIFNTSILIMNLMFYSLFSDMLPSMRLL